MIENDLCHIIKYYQKLISVEKIESEIRTPNLKIKTKKTRETLYENKKYFRTVPPKETHNLLTLYDFFFDFI